MTPEFNPRPEKTPTKGDKWYYPDDIANDMQSVPLPRKVIEETLACSWEYIRCVIPQFTNWPRYISFCRIICMGILAEVHGNLVDILDTDEVFGYSVQEQLDIVFRGTAGYEDMCREYRFFLLMSSDKCSKRRDSELFRRYANSLASSAKTWFRMRDCDALARFTIVAAMRCNDQDKTFLSEEEWQILAEIGDTMYDAVAFYKHRAEAETNSTFAYTGSNRADSFRQCREILWALDMAWAGDASLRCVLNFLRPFGGPIHLMMRRYRFVEDNLTVGKVETEEVVVQTRENRKLWHRVDANETYVEDGRYREAIGQEKRVLFEGMADILDQNGDGRCDDCVYRLTYGAESSGCFGGVVLCGRCREAWKSYMETLSERACAVFPILGQILDRDGGEGGNG
ncbi:uncharacterized protein DNG_09067 [Cephalotrichum gorgonifer]|uniref:ABA 3 protein n=1 Tax=Cephalotrichum gorgonifer TaxID=2041049 RepID=A0AAE8N6U6_9PEZI|nr:uncharacterized protein DNG_09067 [Cephalotrichum gorgonifer]